MNSSLIDQFWDKNKESIVPSYKGSLAVWDYFWDPTLKKRVASPVVLHHVNEDNIDLLVIDISNEKNDDSYSSESESESTESISSNENRQDQSETSSGSNCSSDVKIFWGLPIAIFKDETFILLNDYEKNDIESAINFYYCNQCSNKLSKDSYLCESCDYDLCQNCSEHVKNHPHPMFKYVNYLGKNTYETNNIKLTMTYEI
jgi:hypothetical protein